MKTINLFGLVLLLAVPTFAETEDDKNTLLQMERDWNAALKMGNVAWIERNFAEDASDTSSGNGALHSKADDIALFKEDKTKYESLELADLRVRVEGNAGIVTGVNQIRGRDEEGNAFEVKLAFTDTYIKRGGRWQVWASQHTRIKP